MLSEAVREAVSAGIFPSANQEVKVYTHSGTKIENTMAITIQLFTATSEVAQHPSVSVNVPSGYKILGGGALDHWTGQGNLLTASYPQNLNTWYVAGKDHEKADPAAITGYALAIFDPNNEFDVAINQRTSERRPHPDIQIAVPVGHVLTGGGAFVDWRGAGSLLTASFPSDDSTWSVASKDHDISDPSQITAYAIGIRHRLIKPVQHLIESFTGSVAPHPTAQVCLTDGSYTLCGGGAVDNWTGDGNLLTASYPQQNCWNVAGKDHIHSAPASVTAYVIGIRLGN
jgi:hypothetical protein